MIMLITFTGGNLHQSFYGSTYCMIENGVTSTERTKPMTCELVGTTQFMISNLNSFPSRYLRIYFWAVTVNAANVFDHQVNVKLWANSDAKDGATWMVFNSDSTSSSAAYDL